MEEKKKATKATTSKWNVLIACKEESFPLKGGKVRGATNTRPKIGWLERKGGWLRSFQCTSKADGNPLSAGRKEVSAAIREKNVADGVLVEEVIRHFQNEKKNKQNARANRLLDFVFAVRFKLFIGRRGRKKKKDSSRSHRRLQKWWKEREQHE